jgi:hypothetical protein
LRDPVHEVLAVGGAEYSGFVVDAGAQFIAEPGESTDREPVPREAGRERTKQAEG